MLTFYCLLVSPWNFCAIQEHEREFRDKSESTNGRTVTWTIVQLAVLAITCAWQMRHLRVFFEARKMI